ncbi:GM17626 [Drosophila sechellia]|uniref:GM17626 n=1 Tax=Drosophila sechellia TaxID=7238 RepID=B4IG49_DROSE|nr:GM17626 [Drosophila sechellia]
MGKKETRASKPKADPDAEVSAKIGKKETRTSKPKVDPDAEGAAKMFKASALKKVFFMSQELLPKDADDGHLRLELFFHPGHGKEALFITHPDGRMMELVAFGGNPVAVGFVDSEVCPTARTSHDRAPWIPRSWLFIPSANIVPKEQCRWTTLPWRRPAPVVCLTRSSTQGTLNAWQM